MLINLFKKSGIIFLSIILYNLQYKLKCKLYIIYYSMITTILLTLVYLLNYNIKVINSKMDLIKKAIVKPEYNISQKLKLARELSKLKKDRYIAIITEDLE
jgi:hypothetical protein